LLAVLAALSIAAQSWWAGREPAAVIPGESAAVAVLSFAVTGGPGARDLGAGLENLLAARLDGADGLRSVLVSARLDRGPGRVALLDRQAGAAIARRASARLYVIGQLVSAGGRLQASATLYDRGNANAPVARAEAAVEETALFDLADELAAELIAGFYRGPDERLTRVAATSTRSLPALKAYLEGGRRFHADSLAGAVDAFRRAVRADTAFALAYYRLSVAADWSGRPELAIWAARLAARFSDRLSERDRALVEAYLVQRQGRIDEAERRYQRIVADYPEDAEAWFQLAEVFFHFNPLRGRSSTEARPALERVVALSPGHREALLHLARIAALQGRRAEVDTLVRLAMTGASGSAVLDLRAFRAFALGDRPGEDQATRDLIANPGVVPAKTALTIAVRAGDLNEVENFARLLSRDSLSCEVRGLGRRMRAQAALARGLWDSAGAVLGSPEACDGAASLELRAVYQTLLFVRADRTRLRELLLELRASRRSDLGTTPRDAAVRRYSVGLTALAVGDTVLARQAATALASPGDSGWDGALVRSLTQSLRSRLALHRGQTARALALLEEAQWERTPVPTVAEVGDRFLRAELLRQLDRDQEAAGWYRSIAERSSYELVYLAPAEYRLGQIYDHQGEHSAALAHYRRFLELWRDAEPKTHPFISEANRRVGELQASATE
jgi:tetratricopeptide (TPR) repeat protein